MRKRKNHTPARAEELREHERFMRRALRLARRGEGWTSPNPMVGAVVARDGRILSEGWHRRPGAEHAEAMALRLAGRRARGATLHVTLEPCNHTGRTSPCTEVVRASGLSRVVIGMKDPNPDVRGGGARRLARDGIQVVQGVCAQECRALNAAFVKHAETGRPFVTLKMAASLDGKVTGKRGHRTALSGPESARFVHDLRHAADAILVGVGTVLIDDPALTTRRRTAGGKPRRGKDPRRIIVDSRLRTGVKARVLQTASGAGTVIATTHQASRARQLRLEAAGAEVRRFPSRSGRVDLRRVLASLGKEGIQSVLIEGGPQISASAMAGGLVDRLVIIVAPFLVGGDDTPGLLAAALPRPLKLEGLRVRKMGADTLFEADIIASG